MEQILTAEQHFWFVTFASYISIGGGLLLWLGFAAWGLVVKKFEMAYGVRMFWQIYPAAPAGLFIYLCMQAVASLRQRNLGVPEQLTGFLLLTLSGLLCVWAVWHFRKILHGLLEES